MTARSNYLGGALLRKVEGSVFCMYGKAGKKV